MITQLPDLGKSFQYLKLLLDLETKLLHQEDAISIGIKLAISEEEPFSEIVEYVRELIRCSPDIMETILGEELISRICLA